MSPKNETYVEDVYSETAERINRALRNKTPMSLDNDVGKSRFSRSPWWIYLIAPVCGMVVSIVLAISWSWNPSLAWIALLVGELVALNLSIFGIVTDMFSQTKSVIMYLLVASISTIFIFWPGAMSRMLYSVGSLQSGPTLPILYVVTVVIIYFGLCTNAVVLTLTIETVKTTFSDFASTFRATAGVPVNKAVAIATRVVLQMTNNGVQSEELEYLRVASQAMIDSSGTRVLPWLVLLTIVSLGFNTFLEKILVSKVSLLTNVSSDAVSMVAPAFQLGCALAVMYFAFNVAHRTYIDVVILQAIRKIQQRGNK